MARYRVGVLMSLIFEDEYAIQKKRWWGWSNWAVYSTPEEAALHAKKLEEKGNQVEWHL